MKDIDDTDELEIVREIHKDTRALTLWMRLSLTAMGVLGLCVLVVLCGILAVFVDTVR